MAHPVPMTPSPTDPIRDPRSRHPDAGAVEIEMPPPRAADNGLGTRAAAIPHPRALPSGAPPAAVLGDWGVLFSAVKERLAQTVAEWQRAAREPRQHANAMQSHAGVLECVTALDELDATFKHEFGRRRQLELDVFDAQTALAQARAELAGTQPGDRRARHLALHDGLTSLPNRSCFHERLDQALAHAGPDRHALSVLYLDLDGFKAINDTHGQDTGDQLLRIVGARLSRALRAEDMVSRVGDDEFACLLTDLPSRVQLSHLACKLFDAVSAPLQIGHLRVTIRPSIGIAKCPTDGASAEALLNNADAAMYSAKRQQSGYAFFDERGDVWAHAPA